VLNEELRRELIAMRDEDMRVRAELVAANELGGAYVPRMEAVHVKNAARPRELLVRHGWPAEDIAGKDGSEAAWIIAQHAIEEPEFQRQTLLRMPVARPRGKHAAYLEDCIAMLEGRPQFSAPNGSMIPASAGLDHGGSPTPKSSTHFRLSVGLPIPHPIPERGPDLPAVRQKEVRENIRLWQEWLASKGWPRG
jgi:hypothetical protein